jgi:hypothetical protein
MPAGSGTSNNVLVTVLGVASNTVNYAYNAPIISSISPVNASTSGGTVLTVFGQNFFITGSATLGGVSCPATQTGFAHTTILCSIPIGQGTNQPLVVTVGGQSASFTGFSYNAPSIVSVAPTNGPTSGLLLLPISLIFMFVFV